MKNIHVVVHTTVPQFLFWKKKGIFLKLDKFNTIFKHSNPKKANPYYDLSGVGKWVTIISFALFILVASFNAGNAQGMPKGNTKEIRQAEKKAKKLKKQGKRMRKPKGQRARKWQTKNVRVRCPKYQEYFHYVRRNNIKMQSPDLCPAYSDPRKAGFSQIR